jgi:translocation and assembly module TamA
MFNGLRPCRHRPCYPHAAWSLFIAASLWPSLACAQQGAPGPPADRATEGQAPADPLPAEQNTPLIDPDSGMAAEPGIGVDWPDMGQADTIVPITPEPDDAVAGPVETATDRGTPGAALPDAAIPEAEIPEAEIPDAGINADPDAEPVSRSAVVSEQRYHTAINGLDAISDTQFRDRFAELSVLKQGENKPANLAQINRRIKEDTELLNRLMRAKGYYDARIRGSVAAAANGRLQVTFDVVPGTLYLLQSVTLTGLTDAGEREAKLREAFPVKVGDPVDADRIVVAQGGLARALGENGFPFAKVEDPSVRIDHDSLKGDLDMMIATGGYRTFGKIIMSNERLFSARHVQKIARFSPGDTYMTSDIEDLRKALVATSLVSSVKLTPTDAGDGVHVDVAVDVTKAPPRTIAGEIGYGTGEGFRVEGNWQHRNFFPPEGALILRGVLGTQEQLGSATYRRSNFRERDQVLTILGSASNTTRDAYDARTITLSGMIERQTNIVFQKKWIWSVGAELVASAERDSFSKIAGGGRRTFLIAALPTGLTYDGSDDLLNPSRGFRLGGRISPELSFQDTTFGYVKAQVDGSIYQPMGERLVLAARARLGSIVGSSVSQIAPSRRFYAGGGGSVRGYGYQDIGPRDTNNDPIGGKSLAEFSIEARVRFGNFGVVPFVDAGNISTQFLPHLNDLRIGAGVGARYYSSFGPIRVDVGTPVNPQKGDAKIAVYVSLGQAF